MGRNSTTSNSKHTLIGWYALALAIVKSAQNENDTVFFNSNWYAFLEDSVNTISKDLCSAHMYVNHSQIKF